jgi:hypothetical protein
MTRKINKMKKIYVKPVVEVLKMDEMVSICAGSTGRDGYEEGTGGVGAKESLVYDTDEEWSDEWQDL